MSSSAPEVWQFVVEWYDPQPQMKRRYVLKYYVETNQVEMIDVKNKRLFLKKSDCPPEITPADFFLGSKVVIFARELEIVDYNDPGTRQKLQHQTQKSIAILTPDCYHNWGKILDNILQRMNLVKLKLIQLTSYQAEKVSKILTTNSSKVQILTSGLCVLLSVNGEDGIAQLVNIARNIRSEFGSNERDSAILFASTGVEVMELGEALSECSTTATLDSCTCCIIKPHAVKERLVGPILDTIISQGYEVSAIETLHFDRVQAEEFLEVYKGVVPEYQDHAIQLTSGLSVAIELRAEDAVTTFRQTAGPWDVDIAKEIRPGTIRAMYGKDKIRNTLHCTDLASDGVSECEYCFHIMPAVKL